MKNKYIIRRYLLFALALFVNALGIAYITKASLGTSPITSVTYVASMFTPLTMGQWTIVLNLLFVVVEAGVGLYENSLGQGRLAHVSFADSHYLLLRAVH